MNIAYSLTQDISCEKLCKDLQKLIEKELKNNTDMSQKVLIINLVDVSYTNTDVIPKLEHKQDS